MKLLEEHSGADDADNRDTRKPPREKRWYSGPGAQVLIAMALGVVVGLAFPGAATDLKILGDLFLALIKAGVAPWCSSPW